MRDLDKLFEPKDNRSRRQKLLDHKSKNPRIRKKTNALAKKRALWAKKKRNRMNMMAIEPDYYDDMV